MHSTDTEKSDEEFNEELLAILTGTSIHHRPKERYDFSKFVFPDWTIHMSGFRKPADFSGAQFEGDAEFIGFHFSGDVTFFNVQFNSEVRFMRAVFDGEANFLQVRFRSQVRFVYAIFRGPTSYELASFASNAYFTGTQFESGVTFSGAKFKGGVDFSRLILGPKSGLSFGSRPQVEKSKVYVGSGSALADFSFASFQEPSQVVFFQVNRGTPQGIRLRTKGCAFDDVKFQDVNWARPKSRLTLQDELDMKREPTSSESTHELVAIAYRQLINNFEKSRHYSLAEDCFCGAMEMTRCDPRNFLFSRYAWVLKLYETRRLARWFGENVSVLSAYRFLSNYGSSYRRALVVLFCILILFSILLPFAGLQKPVDPPDSPVTQPFYWSLSADTGDQLRTLAAGWWTAIDTAAFQRRPVFEPVKRWGKRVELIETLAVPGQLALLLLALRRRFRR
jgi:uncharacterized protein YjbI with pentapeptide repeats